MKKAILAIIASLLLTTQVWAEPANERGHNPIMKVLYQLTLSDQQKEDIRQQLKNSRADRAVFREDMKQLKRALREIVNGDDWDANTATETLMAHADLKRAIAQSRALTHHNIWLLLTTEQQQQLNEITADRENSNDAYQHNWNSIAQRLELSGEQASAIEVLRSDFEQQRLAYKDTRRSHNASERVIIRTESFNQIAWESLYAEHEQAMLEHALARTYMQHQILQVLTESQRKKLKKLERKMRKKNKGKKLKGIRRG